jgi:uncharacterized Fe-S center protein
MACAEAVGKQVASPKSMLAEAELDLGDNFTNANPDTRWMASLEHGEKLGLGTREYELIEI